MNNGYYRVRLHFAELNKTAAGTRLFDVRLENTTVLSNFDVWAQAGGIDKAIVREFPIRITDGVVDVDFMKRVENAKISAIEIIPTDGPDTTAPAVVTGVAATAADLRHHRDLVGKRGNRSGRVQRVPGELGRRHLHQAEHRVADRYVVQPTRRRRRVWRRTTR